MNKKVKNIALIAFIVILTVVNIKYLKSVFTNQNAVEEHKRFIGICETNYEVFVVKQLKGFDDFSVIYSIKYKDSLVQGFKKLPGDFDYHFDVDQLTGVCVDSFFVLKYQERSSPVLTIDIKGFK